MCDHILHVLILVAILLRFNRSNYLKTKKAELCSKQFMRVKNDSFFLFMRPIEDLINSGKTLTKKETLAVERYIQANSEQISLRELNDLKCIAAIRKRWK